MKKIIAIVTGSLVVGMIISPVLGMAIGSTRELILNMAPENVILQLADKIDSNRTEAEDKISELQAIVDSQKNQIEEQIKRIDEQKPEPEKTKDATYNTEDNKGVTKPQADSVSAEEKQKNCLKAQKLYSTVPTNKDGECRILGPSNIVDAVEETRKHMTGAKNTKCHENYYKNRLKPAYDEYKKYKELCGN